jgi:hypothetical protein
MLGLSSEHQALKFRHNGLLFCQIILKVIIGLYHIGASFRTYCTVTDADNASARPLLRTHRTHVLSYYS